MGSPAGSTDQGQLPIIVGVAQLVNRSEGPEDAREPLDLMTEAARAAADDTQVKGLLERADSVQVVNTVSWAYRDAPGHLAEAVGAQPREKVYTAVGGNAPQWLVSRTADAIVRGDGRRARIRGGEAPPRPPSPLCRRASAPSGRAVRPPVAGGGGQPPRLVPTGPYRRRDHHR